MDSTRKWGLLFVHSAGGAAQEPPRFAMSALSSPALAGPRKERESIHTPSRLGKGAQQHPRGDGFAHPPAENKQK